MSSIQNEKLIYRSPKNADGNHYFVPIVCKNKDYLVAYIQGVTHILNHIVMQNKVRIDLFLDSTRFSDIIDDKGTRSGQLTEEEIRKKIKKGISEEQRTKSHPENADGILPVVFFEIDCDCGMYHSFKTHNDIPENGMNCFLCEKTLIDFTGHADEDFEYDRGEKLK